MPTTDLSLAADTSGPALVFPFAGVDLTGHALELLLYPGGADTPLRSLSLNGNLASDAWRAVTPAPHYLGRDGAGRNGDGFYDLIALGPTRLTNTQLQAVAVPYA